MVACTLQGCVFSETITEIIYDQDEAYEIDYDADPIYINSPTGQVKSDQLPNLSTADQGANNVDDGLPEFQGDLSQATVKEADTANTQAGDANLHDSLEKTDLTPNEGSEAGDDGALHTEGAGDAAAANSDAAGGAAASSNAANQGTTANAGNTTNNNQGTSGTGTQGGGSTGRSDVGGGRADGTNNAGNNGDDATKPSDVGFNPGDYFADDGANDDLPNDVHTVAAVGNAAIVACVLGGADGDANLVAANAELLQGNAGRVLANRGIGSARVVWQGSGAQGESLDVEALLAVAPDAVLITEGEDSLPGDARGRLETAGVHVISIPTMTSAQRTRAAVQRVGSLLGRGGDKTAAQVAADYLRFHDDIVNSCATSDVLYTLYVSQWVDAVYTGPLSGSIAVTGAAFAPAGSAAAAGSGYLAAAGVQNTAAVKMRYSTRSGNAIVWPFAGGTQDSEWQGVSGVNDGLEITGTGYDLALTRISPTNDYHYFDLGDGAFPVLICGSAQVASAIEADRARGGVYAPAHEATSVATAEYGLVVNPYGLFSSWTRGSMESVLEAAFARESVWGAHDGYLEDRTRDFYATFYGFDLGGEYADIVSATYFE